MTKRKVGAKEAAQMLGVDQERFHFSRKLAQWTYTTPLHESFWGPTPEAAFSAAVALRGDMAINLSENPNG